MSSLIEWTDETWNPTVGCSKASPGCDHCYAINVAHRAMQPAHEGLTIRKPGEAPNWTGEVRCLPDRLAAPLKWRKPRRVFVDSMSDLFHPDVPSEFIEEVFATAACAPRHTFQILTKRPQRMARWFAYSMRAGMVAGAAQQRGLSALLERVPMSEWWPLRNVWLGTSIESDRYVFRADHLRATPAVVRFLSLEPLLGPLPSLDLTGIDWVIVGGESGPHARPMHPDWVRDIRDRCASAGVPFFFKQWGSWAPEAQGTHRVNRGGSLYRNAPTCVMSGEELVSRAGKKVAGRELDGRTWDEMPKASAV